MTIDERLMFDPTPVAQWSEPIADSFPWLTAGLASLAAAAVFFALYCWTSRRDAKPEPMEWADWPPTDTTRSPDWAKEDDR